MSLRASFDIVSWTSPYYLMLDGSYIKNTDMFKPGDKLQIFSSGWCAAIAEMSIYLSEEMSENALLFIIEYFNPPEIFKQTIESATTRRIPGKACIMANVQKISQS